MEGPRPTDLDLDSVPEVTIEMMQEASERLGIYASRYDVNTITAFWSNETPAYAIGHMTAEHYPGERSWENAWQALLDGLDYLVVINSRNEG